MNQTIDHYIWGAVTGFIACWFVLFLGGCFR
jgi:hypothetical protein